MSILNIKPGADPPYDVLSCGSSSNPQPQVVPLERV
jgi:hypothetical protein